MYPIFLQTFISSSLDNGRLLASATARELEVKLVYPGNKT
jgi:hypothetical protein